MLSVNIRTAMRGMGQLKGIRALVAGLLCFGVLVLPARAQAAPLTLQDALSRALAVDSVAAAAKARIRGAEAGVRKANRRLNPSLGGEVENFGGSGAHQAFRRAETTFFYQQPIELGGKREARTDVARSEVVATRARGTARVLDLLRDVEVAWVDAVVAAAQLRVAEDRLAIAQQLSGEIARRAQAGRDPSFTQSRAEAQLALEQIAVDQARAAAGIARAHLAAYWRGAADFEVDVDLFESAVAVFDAKLLNAELAVLEAEINVATARVILERARVIQDPVFRVGVRHFSETGDTALIGGFSIPLPIFDNNQDNIEKAQAERRAAELDLTSARKALRREVTRLKARLLENATESRRIQAEVLPPAQRAVQLIREGLERGGFNYIEFADAQRTLNDARLRRVEILKSFHLDKATLNRLTGRHTRLETNRGRRR